MKPVIVCSAFRRPRGIATSAGATGDAVHQAYSVVEEIPQLIEKQMNAAALIVPAFANKTAVEAAISVADGLLLAGGSSNIHPKFYSRPLTRENQKLDPLHDETDLMLIKAAMARGTPILGICRGMQVLNVALGGTLLEDLTTRYQQMDHNCSADCEGFAPSAEEMHAITCEKDSQMYDLLGKQTVMINSIHEQAIDDLAPGLRVEARSADGLIEAFSKPDYPDFFMGLQWHPECMPDDAVNAPLFAAFAQAAAAGARE